MNNATTKIGCVANLWSKMMHFNKIGDIMPSHAHIFDHLTLLCNGSLNVTVDGVSTEFIAPHMIYIQAGKVHTLTALEDNTLAYCIHALRDGDSVEDIIDPDMVPKGIDPLKSPQVRPLVTMATLV